LTVSTEKPAPPADPAAWYVVHTRTKAEHIAAGMLESIYGIPSYCPRIKFQRATARGKVWFIEALFPSYFFARFDPALSLRAVRHSQSVLNVVEFGGDLARVPDAVIDAIRTEMDGQLIKELAAPLQPGDLVEITDGPMRGLAGIVHSLRKGEERVRILLDFLGSQNPIEVPAHTLLSPRSARSMLAEGRKR
jgi:transcriptional antiterminator RfaH